jgi:hypothetical protein
VGFERLLLGGFVCFFGLGRYIEGRALIEKFLLLLLVKLLMSLV